MKTIRKFAYAAVFAVSAVCLTAASAAAETAHGRFTLTHEVHWQQAVLPAGDYYFTIGEQGPSELLTIEKMSGGRTGFMMMVQDTEPVKPDATSQLVVVSTPAGAFVDRMDLPDYGMSLHFKVPSQASETAKSAVIASASGK